MHSPFFEGSQACEWKGENLLGVVYMLLITSSRRPNSAPGNLDTLPKRGDTRGDCIDTRRLSKLMQEGGYFW